MTMPKTLLALESSSLRVEIDDETAALVSLTNKLTGEIFSIDGDQFSIAADDRRWEFADFRAVECASEGDAIRARFSCDAFDVETICRLGATGHFVEKQMT